LYFVQNEAGCFDAAYRDKKVVSVFVRFRAPFTGRDCVVKLKNRLSTN
jgi:hypothetical protein